MKYLLIVFLTFGCSSSSSSKYKKQFHLEDFKSAKTPAEVHALLADRMTRCYPQSEYPVYEKTVAKFDDTNESGSVAYEMNNPSMSLETLVLVEVAKDETGSVVKVYAKGNLFRPGSVYKHHIHKWLEGKKVDCDSFGQI